MAGPQRNKKKAGGYKPQPGKNPHADYRNQKKVEKPKDITPEITPEQPDIRNIQWFPGHMTRTRRKIQESLKLVDAAVEIVDARIPMSSRNPEMDSLTAGKPRLIILNKADLADEASTKRWMAYFRSQGMAALAVDCKSGRGCNQFNGALRELLSDLVEKWESKGAHRAIRAMIVGIPNVGKSSFINRMNRGGKAKVEDRPGVTRSKQWVPVDQSLELLDTPGILWPKFEDQSVGMNLAYTGAVRDEIMDLETLACHLMAYLGVHYPNALLERYKVEVASEDSGYDLLMKAGRKRGFVVRGGEIDTERMAKILLDEFRGGKLGRFTLELPE